MLNICMFQSRTITTFLEISENCLQPHVGHVQPLSAFFHILQPYQFNSAVILMLSFNKVVVLYCGLSGYAKMQCDRDCAAQNSIHMDKV